MADFLLCEESLDGFSDSPADEPRACRGEPEDVSDDEYEDDDDDDDCYWEDSVEQEDTESSESEEVSEPAVLGLIHS